MPGSVLAGGPPVVVRLAAVFLAGLLFAFSYVVTAVSPNALAGVRNPWTLADDWVWKRVHERAVPVLRIAAVLTGLGALAPTLPAALALMLAPVLLAALYLTWHSWRLSSR